MSKPLRRVFSREFKLGAVRRLEDGARVSAVSAELTVSSKQLYAWRKAFRSGGPAALRPAGRPRKSAAPAASPPPGGAGPAPEANALAAAQARIAALERKLGQQSLELDFFRRALRHVEASRRPSDGPGATASSPSSKR
jgi:transposase